MTGDEPTVVPERGLVTTFDGVWSLAVRRAEVIVRLARLDVVTWTTADAAAAELGVSRRQGYEMLRRWHRGEGVVSDLVPRRSRGRPGLECMPDEVEALMRDLLRRRYLTRQRRSVSAVYRELVRTCRSRGLRVPSRGTLGRRIARLDPIEQVVACQGRDAARSLRAAGGVPPQAMRPSEQVQIDHTVVDVTVGDERHRLPIGGPM